jgi:hypothetical protein
LWNGAYNCSTFASETWNSISYNKVNAGGLITAPQLLKDSIMSKYGYITGKYIPWDYAVYYAQGTGAPKQSTVNK